MVENHRCLHEVDLAEMRLGIANIEKIMEKFDKKLNGLPVKLTLLWRFNWVIFVMIILGIGGALVKGLVS